MLELAGELAETGSEKLSSLVGNGDWTGDGLAAATDVADGFLDLWTREGALLSVIDLAAAAGDARFRVVRTQLLNAPAEAFSTVVARAIEEGQVAADVSAEATAAALVSMLAHVAAHAVGITGWGPSVDELRAGMARIVSWAVSGATGPAPVAGHSG